MKNSKFEAIVKMLAFDFHLVAVLVVLFVFSVGVQAIARHAGAERTDQSHVLYVGGE